MFGKLDMKLKVILHEAEEGGYWAEVPAIPGCATQGDTFDELLENLYEAIEGCLSVDLKEAITFMGKPAIRRGFQFRFMATSNSKQACCSIY